MELNLIEICRVVEFPEGYRFGPHHHSRLEVNLLLSGEALIGVSEDILVHRKSECLIILPGVSHTFEVRKKIKMLQIEFHEKAFSDFGHQAKETASGKWEQLSPDSTIKIDNAHRIHNCMERIRYEFNSQHELTSDLLAIYFNELLLLVKCRLQEQIQVFDKTVSSPLLLGAIRFVENNYRDPLTVEDIAEHLSVSSRHLRQLFRNELNTNICNFIIDYRLKKAKILLKQKQLSISEIAYNTGFNSLQYFSKIFSKNVGIPPSDFLKNYFRNV